MYALDNNSGVVVMPEVKNQQFQPNAPRWFTEGGNGIAPSYPGADWFNIVQAELLNILTDAGMTPDKGQFNQITQAIRAIVSASVKTSLNDKAPIASPIFTGTPKAPTQLKQSMILLWLQPPMFERRLLHWSGQHRQRWILYPKLRMRLQGMQMLRRHY